MNYQELNPQNQYHMTFINMIEAGFVLGCTMAWSDVVSTGTKYIYPNSKSVLEAKLVYALILTFVIIFLFYFIDKTMSISFIKRAEHFNKFRR